MCVFLLFLKHKDFPFYSLILITVWFRYLQTHMNESCMYLSCQLFFKTPHETLNSKGNSRKIYFFVIYRLKFQKSSLWCLQQGHPMEPLN